MAALNEPYSGNIGDVLEANKLCYDQAHSASFNGTFQAFLGSRNQKIDSIVSDRYRNLSVVNTKVNTFIRSMFLAFSKRRWDLIESYMCRAKNCLGHGSPYSAEKKANFSSMLAFSVSMVKMLWMTSHGNFYFFHMFMILFTYFDIPRNLTIFRLLAGLRKSCGMVRCQMDSPPTNYSATHGIRIAVQNEVLLHPFISLGFYRGRSFHVVTSSSCYASRSHLKL